MYLNTFVNTFLYYYFQNIVLIHSIHYKFENEQNIRHKLVQLYSTVCQKYNWYACNLLHYALVIGFI